jgi:hypothetical protein
MKTVQRCAALFSIVLLLPTGSVYGMEKNKIATYGAIGYIALKELSNAYNYIQSKRGKKTVAEALNENPDVLLALLAPYTNDNEQYEIAFGKKREQKKIEKLENLSENNENNSQSFVLNLDDDKEDENETVFSLKDLKKNIDDRYNKLKNSDDKKENQILFLKEAFKISKNDKQDGTIIKHLGDLKAIAITNADAIKNCLSNDYDLASCKLTFYENDENKETKKLGEWVEGNDTRSCNNKGDIHDFLYEKNNNNMHIKDDKFITSLKSFGNNLKNSDFSKNLNNIVNQLTSEKLSKLLNLDAIVNGEKGLLKAITGHANRIKGLEDKKNDAKILTLATKK